MSRTLETRKAAAAFTLVAWMLASAGVVLGSAAPASATPGRASMNITVAS